jgi:DNA gyrase subunit B
MNQLIQHGHMYVAQPPLYRIKTKRETYYVQTEEEMKQQMLERGMEDAELIVDEGRQIAGPDLQKLCQILSGLEDAIVALERRGVSLRTHGQRMNFDTNRLPMYHVVVGTTEHWFTSRAELEKFVNEHEAAVVKDDNKAKLLGEQKVQINEFHEVRTINSSLQELTKLGFDMESLLPQERTGEETSRYTLRRGENEIGLDELRQLIATVRKLGERGLTVTRFKGLGEMNAEELRDTTLDPSRRTLLQVNMTDAGAADEMFRILMGDKVEPRREFIEKHALEVKNLDV